MLYKKITASSKDLNLQVVDSKTPTVQCKHCGTEIPTIIRGSEGKTYPVICPICTMVPEEQFNLEN